MAQKGNWNILEWSSISRTGSANGRKGSWNSCYKRRGGWFVTLLLLILVSNEKNFGFLWALSSWPSDSDVVVAFSCSLKKSKKMFYITPANHGKNLCLAKQLTKFYVHNKPTLFKKHIYKILMFVLFWQNNFGLWLTRLWWGFDKNYIDVLIPSRNSYQPALQVRWSEYYRVNVWLHICMSS